MHSTTIVYIEKDGKYLMLHRTRKHNDENKDKWIGVGGKFEEGESPEDCARREVREETGLTLDTLNYRGIVTFVASEWPTQHMHLFTSDKFTGELKDCDEGELEWVDKRDIERLPIWEGDKLFLRLLDTDEGFFSLKLVYAGDRLIRAIKNEKPIVDRI